MVISLEPSLILAYNTSLFGQKIHHVFIILIGGEDNLTMHITA